MQALSSVLKTFLIKREIPCIPPLFNNNKFISNFRDKAELFNNFFCSTVYSDRQGKWNSCYTPTKILSSILVTTADVSKITKNLDPNKAHAHYMISIRMLKLCDDSVLPSLELIFKSFVESGRFPSQWEKSAVVQVHKIGW